MLAKLTRGNQLTIPKPIVQRAGLKAGRDYLSVMYLKGIICLKPVEIKERIPAAAYDALIKEAFTIQPGDIVADERTAAQVLKRRMKKR